MAGTPDKSDKSGKSGRSGRSGRSAKSGKSVKEAQSSRLSKSAEPTATVSNELAKKSGRESAVPIRAPTPSKRPQPQPQTVCPLLLPRVKRSYLGEPLLPLEEPLRNRWHIKGLIGHGGYGEIYFAIDTRTGEEVAVKAEPKKRRGRTAKRMILEQEVLIRLQGRPHTPRFIASGSKDNRINFIVMQLLSVNVGDLKKASPYRRLSKSTVGRVIIQLLAALRDVHTVGFLHRDVKPANICLGITPYTRHCLMLVDFGLVRRYRLLDGTKRAARERAGFRGTLRYVSIRVHDRMEQSPADDLISAAYTAIELMAEALPWKHTYKSDEIRKCKQDLHITDCAVLLDQIGPVLQDFTRNVCAIGPDDDPDYKFLQNILMDMTGGKKMSDTYDWEEEYREVRLTGAGNTFRKRARGSVDGNVSGGLGFAG